MLEEIKAWRQRQHNDGLPSSMADFFCITNTCPECRGSGWYANDRDCPDGKGCPFCNGMGRY